MSMDIIYDPMTPEEFEEFKKNAYSPHEGGQIGVIQEKLGGVGSAAQTDPTYDNYQNFNGRDAFSANVAFASSSQEEKKSEPKFISGGFDEGENEKPNDDYKKLKSNTGKFEEISSHDLSTPMGLDDYGADGYLNHMHIRYEGGDDGESYITGPDSDITFLDIIQPTVLPGHE